MPSVSLAEDLTSETFFRALRSISSFSWQGKNFGAWLTTIARNLVADHYTSSRSRLEVVADEVPDRVDASADTESLALASLSSQALVDDVIDDPTDDPTDDSPGGGSGNDPSGDDPLDDVID
ncbi:MAG: hypothetical protein M3419_07625 [Actinomycetota bacterium]|nr:hypothetical protein [Actinomycetota bacterium]